MTLQERLFVLRDENYARFQAKLTPTVPAESFIGVRVPELRALAKTLWKEGGAESCLSELPHRYYDENMLHALLLSEMKDFSACIRETERFLPYVDNWAVCDILSPKVFKKNREELLEKIRVWSASTQPYTCRFALEMLMSFYLDEGFRSEYLEIPAAVQSEEYYVRMMQAWFFATALTKQWNAALPYLQNGRLKTWTHNKTIQKARESFRITKEQKEYLQTLKR